MKYLPKINDSNLLKLIEECGELVQISAQRYTKPKNYPIESLVEEMGDVLAQIQIFQRLNPKLTPLIQSRANLKMKKLYKQK